MTEPLQDLIAGIFANPLEGILVLGILIYFFRDIAKLETPYSPGGLKALIKFFVLLGVVKYLFDYFN